MIPLDVSTPIAVLITFFVVVIAWSIFCAGGWRKP